MSLKIVVPVRDRDDHLEVFLKKIGEFVTLPHQIYVVEQSDDGQPFNRAKLLNVGFNHSKGVGYYCFHDVDLIPETPNCDYRKPAAPTHMSVFNSQTNYRQTYENAFGGVVLFTPSHFELVNGYSNEYWGWGLEDDDMRKRLVKRGIPVFRRFGRYTSLHHTPARRGPFDSATPDQKAKSVELMSPEWLKNYHRYSKWYDFTSDGLSNLKYRVISTSRVAKNVERVKVDLLR
jgi:hypothetical protein